MTKPIPICHTPTPDAREAFVRAAWAAKIGWCSAHVPNATDQAILIRDVRKSANYTHGYLVPERGAFMFVEYPEDLPKMLETGTLVNSPLHFVQYARRMKSNA